MLYVDIPSHAEFQALRDVRGDACVSIYLRTTPLSQQAHASQIELGNLARQACAQLEAIKFDKRRLAALMEHIETVESDDEFWRLQANSLAVFATPDSMRVYRLANHLTPMVEVSDRFHLKPLLRAITFPHSASVLALSENAVRLVEVHPDLPATTLKVEGLPKDAASAVGKSTLNDHSTNSRVQGLEGQNVRFRQYLRKVDAALRTVLRGQKTPLILAATGRLAPMFREINSYAHLVPEGINESPDHVSDADLAQSARPILDAAYARQIGDLKSLYDARSNSGRATSDVSDAARAATFGAIETLLVDIDSTIHGTIDDKGAVSFANKPDAKNYGIVDEIAGRAMASGAEVLGVRKVDMPGEADVAAILRFPV